MKIKKGDTVKIISGKENGKEGKVLQVIPRKNLVLVEGVNVVKKHQKLSLYIPGNPKMTHMIFYLAKLKIKNLKS